MAAVLLQKAVVVAAAVMDLMPRFFFSAALALNMRELVGLLWSC
jgi:hypothetical protein